MSTLTAGRPRLSARWRSFDAWVGTRRSVAALFLLALAVFALESAVLPAYAGRDMARYLQTYVQLGYHVPIYPVVLNTRGPLTALGVGLPLQIGGWAAEAWLGLLYALSVVAWARVAYTFGSRAAALVSVLLLASPGYGILFHQLASDALFAAAFSGWAVLLARAIQRPSTRAFLLAGAVMGLLVLVRPANQVILFMALLPLVLRAPWRDRLAWGAALFIPAVGVAQSWKIFVYLRWGDVVPLKPSTGLLALALILVPLLLPGPWRVRAALAVAPLIVLGLAAKGLPGESPAQYVRSVVRNESNQFLYRSFELDRIMSPDNGPASRRVARVVERELLTREPYRSYGVDVHEFFASGSDRVFGDMTSVVPGDDLAGATREAIRRHPTTLAKSIGRTIWEELALRPVYAPLPAAEANDGTTASKQEFIVVNGRRLPKPSEGQPIPASAIGPALYTTGGPALEVWRSATEHKYVYSDPRDERRAEKFGRATERLAARIPTRQEHGGIVHRLNQASHVFPPLVVWLVIGLVAIAWRRPRGALVALAPAIAGLVVIVASALVVPSVAEYAAPVSPAFLMLAAAGLVGVSERRSFREAERAAAPGEPGAWRRIGVVVPLAGAAVAIVAGAWAAKSYVSNLKSSVDLGQAPHDLDVFLRASSNAVHGVSPYVFLHDQTYAYPPLLAFLAAPFHAIGAGWATVAWTLVSLVAIALALWLLGVRDWRCYALSAAYPMTRSAVDLGTVGPLLLLAVAAAWHWRDRVLEPAVAVGAAVALKLFLWPLGAWLALTRRLSAAVAAVGAASVLVIVPWAGISFAGLGDFTGLLRRLSHEEASSSYSVTALAVRAHLPQSVGYALSLFVAVGLLAAAAWIARDGRRTPRDRDAAALTLALAAALAASPIVWVHYFLLLLVPLALTHPRLSLLWFVPFAYYPLGESAWPAGDARKLALALVATTIIFVASLWRGGYAVLRTATCSWANRSSYLPATRARKASIAGRGRSSASSPNSAQK